MHYLPTIGLEIHLQLNTNSKMFSNSLAKFGCTPNTNANYIDLGLPGVLPSVNETAITQGIMFGLWVNGTISSTLSFARKHYFYPDLTKGYQITQDDDPIVTNGKVDIAIDGKVIPISITRAHLEEDAGKSIHNTKNHATEIDYNRAGTPLLEIVSGPDFKNAKEAVAYAKNIFQIVHYLGICKGSMKEGAFRVDCNISIRPENQDKLGNRVEIKNLNSFRAVEAAINYEIAEQTKILNNNEVVLQQTKLFDVNSNTTKAMRSKENAADYRYIFEPDIPVSKVTLEMVNKAKELLPKVPTETIKSINDKFSLSTEEEKILLQDLVLLDFFHQVAENVSNKKLLIHWVFTEFLAKINKASISIIASPISSKKLSDLINLIDAGAINATTAKDILDAMWQDTNLQASTYIKEHGLEQISDPKIILAAINSVLKNNADKVSDYNNGKVKLYGFFVGQTMKELKGKACPKTLNQLLTQTLKG